MNSPCLYWILVILSSMSEKWLTLLWNSWHMKIPTMIDRKFSKYPSAVNWNKRVRDERQRALNEFLKAGFQFLCFSFFLFFFWLVGKSSLVPKMYKEVQGSVSVFWIMQWSQRGRREENKIPTPPLYHQLLLLMVMVVVMVKGGGGRLEKSPRMDDDGYGWGFSGRFPVRQINSHSNCIQN